MTIARDWLKKNYTTGSPWTWAGDRTMEQWWADCPNGQWMLDVAEQCRVPATMFVAVAYEAEKHFRRVARPHQREESGVLIDEYVASTQFYCGLLNDSSLEVRERARFEVRRLAWETTYLACHVGRDNDSRVDDSDIVRRVIPWSVVTSVERFQYTLR